MNKKEFLKFNSGSIFLILALIILIGGGIYLAFIKYAEPKFKIQSIDNIEPPKITQVPGLQNQDYLDKLIARDWYWVETVVDSSVGIKPYDLSAFKIKFNSNLTFQSSSDCNFMSGKYEVFENKIKFKEIVRTEKYCMKSKESDYVDGLNNAYEINFENKDQMVLKYKNSNSFMRFK